MCALLEKRHVVGREPDARDARLARRAHQGRTAAHNQRKRPHPRGLSADVFRDRWTVAQEIASLGWICGSCMAPDMTRASLANA